MLEVKNEIYKDVPKKFLEKFDRYEPVILDNTAISLYKLCPRKYQLRIAMGFDEIETKPYFVSGSSYHKYRDQFEINWKANADLSFIDRVDYSHIVAESEAIKLWNKITKDKEVPAPNTKWDWITRSRLTKSLSIAKEWISVEKKNNNIIVIATEQPFIVEVIPNVFWGGKADQVARWNNRLWGRDFKTSSKEGQYYKRTLKPNSQFIGYTVAEELLHGSTVDGQLVEVLYNTKTAGPKITPYPNSFNIYEKGIWKRDLASWSDKIKKSRELDLYEVSESHCSFCQFHMVCSNTSENGMMATLESKFKLNPWDFQNIDGEED